MKRDFETSKLYYGFPIFILGYKDEKYGYNITTSSSSYSLGDQLTVGIGASGNAARQIRKFGQFTLNIPTEATMLEMEEAGFLSGQDKLAKTGLAYQLSDRVDAPILEACPLILECQVDDLIEKEGILHIFAKIVGRKVEETLLGAKGFDSQHFHPVYFMGDGHERVYRYLKEGVSDKLGSFLKTKPKNQE